jgi:hypothetical protein
LDEMAVAHSWQTLLGGRASRMLPHPIHLTLGLPLRFVVESAACFAGVKTPASLQIGFFGTTKVVPCYKARLFRNG